MYIIHLGLREHLRVCEVFIVVRGKRGNVADKKFVIVGLDGLNVIVSTKAKIKS
jgi:hypothetical protein